LKDLRTALVLSGKHPRVVMRAGFL